MRLPLTAALLLLALPAHADPVPPRCTSGDGAPGWCLDEGSIRAADAAQTALPEVRLQLRLAEQRATTSAGDAIRLAATVDAQAATVLDLRRALAAETNRLPAWSWYLTGVASGVVLTVAAIVIGALSL